MGGIEVAQPLNDSETRSHRARVHSAPQIAPAARLGLVEKPAKVRGADDVAAVPEGPRGAGFDSVGGVIKSD